jgi:hypothetical protein
VRIPPAQALGRASAATLMTTQRWVIPSTHRKNYSLAPSRESYENAFRAQRLLYPSHSQVPRSVTILSSPVKCALPLGDELEPRLPSHTTPFNSLFILFITHSKLFSLFSVLLYVHRFVLLPPHCSSRIILFQQFMRGTLALPHQGIPSICYISY